MPKYGTPYILDRKAREYLMYKPADRKGIREAFRAAIEAGGDNTDPETVVAYFSNLCDDYRNTDEVMPDEIIAEYDRLTPFFEKNPAAAEYKSQFDAAFGLSGAGNAARISKDSSRASWPPAPDDRGAAFAGRGSDDRALSATVISTSRLPPRNTIEVKPSSETAMFLAQAFQNKKDYVQGEDLPERGAGCRERPRRDVRNCSCASALVRPRAPNELFRGAARPLRASARDLDPEDGVSVLHPGAVLCFVGRLRVAVSPRLATYWAAYDTMAKAGRAARRGRFGVHESTTKMFPRQVPLRFSLSSEECFFNELQEGARYTVTCGTAAGITTTVRAR